MSMTGNEYTNEQLIDFMYDVMDWRGTEDTPMVYAVIEALKEREAYRAIGTVSEFRELKEKATAKKPAYQGEHEKCPTCGSFCIGEYCIKCGQHLDWSEGKE